MNDLRIPDLADKVFLVTGASTGIGAAVAKELGGLPVAADSKVPAGRVQVVLANDSTGPGSGLDGSYTSFDTGAAPSTTEDPAPPPAPVFTAGNDDPKCVN